MAFTALQLITKSFHLSGVVARNLETLTGDKAAEGLYLLNELLGFASAETKLVPYFQKMDILLVAGQEEYELENVIDVESMTFNINNVRYPTIQKGRNRYFATGRVNNLQSLPLSWHIERELKGLKLYVYYLPDQDYTATLMVKKGLTSVDSLQTDISAVYDSFYISYLRYALAEYICDDYDIEFPASKKARLSSIRKSISWVSPPDLTLKTQSMINDGAGTNWAFINLSNGYTP